MDDYINVIYKMLVDNISLKYIIEYVVRKGYKGNLKNIEKYISSVLKLSINSFKYV